MQVDTFADEYTVRQQAKKAVVEQVKYSLDELIHPSDVDENAESWEEIDEDRLNMEIGESLTIMVQENQIPAIRDLAIVLWRESLPRVPMEDLVFDDREKAVHEGYWPYDMDRTDVTEILWEYSNEYEYFPEYLQEAEEFLYPVMGDMLHPLREPDI